MVDLRLLVMEVEFGWVGGWWVVCKPIFVSNPTQLSKVVVVLRLSWGCDNYTELGASGLRITW